MDDVQKEILYFLKNWSVCSKCKHTQFVELEPINTMNIYEYNCKYTCENCQQNHEFLCYADHNLYTSKYLSDVCKMLIKYMFDNDYDFEFLDKEIRIALNQLLFNQTYKEFRGKK